MRIASCDRNGSICRLHFQSGTAGAHYVAMGHLLTIWPDRLVLRAPQARACGPAQEGHRFKSETPFRIFQCDRSGVSGRDSRQYPHWSIFRMYARLCVLTTMTDGQCVFDRCTPSYWGHPRYGEPETLLFHLGNNRKWQTCVPHPPPPNTAAERLIHHFFGRYR